MPGGMCKSTERMTPEFSGIVSPIAHRIVYITAAVTIPGLALRFLKLSAPVP